MTAYTMFILGTGVVSLIATIAYVTSDAAYRHDIALTDWIHDRLGSTGFIVFSLMAFAVLASISAWMVYTDLGQALGWHS